MSTIPSTQDLPLERRICSNSLEDIGHSNLQLEEGVLFNQGWSLARDHRVRIFSSTRNLNDFLNLSPYAFIGNNVKRAYVTLDLSKNTVYLMPNASETKTEEMVYDSEDVARSEYNIIGQLEVLKVLESHRMYFSVTFNELLRDFSVDKARVFYAVYAGQSDSSERWLVTGNGTDKSKWRVIKLPAENHLDIIKRIVARTGYDAAILDNGINHDGKKYEIKTI